MGLEIAELDSQFKSMNTSDLLEELEDAGKQMAKGRLAPVVALYTSARAQVNPKLADTLDAANARFAELKVAVDRARGALPNGASGSAASAPAAALTPVQVSWVGEVLGLNGAADAVPTPGKLAGATVQPPAPAQTPMTPVTKARGAEAQPKTAPAVDLTVLEKRARAVAATLPSGPTSAKLIEMIDAAVAANDLTRLDGIMQRLEAFATKRAADEAAERAAAEAEKQAAEASKKNEELRALAARAAEALKKLPLPPENKKALADVIRSAFEAKDSHQMMEIVGKYEAAALKGDAKIAAEKAATEKAVAEKAVADKAAADKAEADKLEAQKLQKEAADKAEAARVAKEIADKAEAERIAKGAKEAKEAKEAADRVEAARTAKEAADKAEAVRIAKEVADKAEAARVAKEAADKKETERVAKEAADKKEADRVAKEIADKAEADRVAKEIAEKAERDEADRLALAGDHRLVAATLTKPLKASDLTALGVLPPAIAASFVNVLKAVEGDIAAKRPLAAIDREILGLKATIKAEQAEYKAELDKNVAAVEVRDANAEGVEGRDEKKHAAARLAVGESYTKLTAAKGRRDAAKDKLAAVETEKIPSRTDDLLRGALRFGSAFKPAVDPDMVVGLTLAQKDARRAGIAARERAVATVLAQFKDHPELAASALEILPDAAHPEAVAGAIAKIGELRAGNFAGKAEDAHTAAAMATNALKLAGTVGGDFNGRLTAYYASDAPKKSDALRDDNDAKKTTLNYTAGLGAAMLGTGGRLQADAPALQPILDSLHFHPDSLRNPMFNVARHLEKVRADLRNPTIRSACEASLAGITEAPGAVMTPLVRATLNLPGSATVDAAASKKAVLSAALTPLTQGQAGSCFATCNCMDHQEKHPAAFFGDLCTLARTGTLGKGGEVLPVATNIPSGENKLLRGLEYTVASLGATKADSKRKNELATASREGLAPFKDRTQFTELTPSMVGLHRELENAKNAKTAADAAVSTNLDDYNAMVNVSNAATGDRRTELQRQLAVIDAAEAGLKAQAAEAARAVTAATARIATAKEAMVGVLAEATRGALAFEYDATMTLPRGTTTTAVDGSSSSGGWLLKSAETGEVITDNDGLKKCLKKKFTTALPGGSNSAHLDTIIGSVDFLGNLLSKYTHTGPATARKPSGSIFRHVTGGTTKESKELLAGKESETAEIVAAPVAGTLGDVKARALLVGLVDATKTLDHKEVTFVIEGVHGERAIPTHPSLDILKAGILKAGDRTVAEKTATVFEQAQTRAQTPLAPEEVRLFVDKSLRDVITSFLNGADAEIDLSKTPFTGSLKPAQLKKAMIDAIPRATFLGAYAAMDAVTEEATLKSLDQQLDSLLSRELFPQFVVGDTNWGGANSKTSHVVTADLTTGLPRFCNRDESTGVLSAGGNNFLNAKWSKTTTKD